MYTNISHFNKNVKSLKETGKILGINLGKENSDDSENEEQFAAGNGFKAAKMLNNKYYFFR